MNNLKQLAETLSAQNAGAAKLAAAAVAGGGGPSIVDDEDEDIPDLVENFEEVSKT